MTSLRLLTSTGTSLLSVEPVAEQPEVVASPCHHRAALQQRQVGFCAGGDRRDIAQAAHRHRNVAADDAVAQEGQTVFFAGGDRGDFGEVGYGARPIAVFERAIAELSSVVAAPRCRVGRGRVRDRRATISRSPTASWLRFPSSAVNPASCHVPDCTRRPSFAAAAARPPSSVTSPTSNRRARARYAASYTVSASRRSHISVASSITG